LFRYNYLIRTFLHGAVFAPLVNYFKVSAAVAALSSFGVSALLHLVVAYFVFGPHTIFSGANEKWNYL